MNNLEVTTAVQIADLEFGYRPDLPVLLNVQLQLGHGQFLGIVGPNGAGKSTLLKLLTGYLEPTRGYVHLFGKNLSSYSKREIAKNVAFVPQKTESTFPFTVLEMVLMGRHPFGGFTSFDTATDIEIARRALSALAVEYAEQKRGDRLSGGEQQLVILARALAQQPRLLVLDEPTTFLDLGHQWKVLNVLKELAVGGTTIIATFHDLNIAARWCDKLLLLANGKIEAIGKASTVLTQERLCKIYGAPVHVEVLPGDRIRVDFADV